MSYDIDETLNRVLIRSKVIEAKECFRSALEMESLGYPAIAAWERSLSRQYLREARMIKGCIDK